MNTKTRATSPKMASLNLIRKRVVPSCLKEGSAKEISAPVSNRMTKMELAQTHQSRFSIFRRFSTISRSFEVSRRKSAAFSGVSIKGRLGRITLLPTLEWARIAVKEIPASSARIVTQRLTFEGTLEPPSRVDARRFTSKWGCRCADRKTPCAGLPRRTCTLVRGFYRTLHILLSDYPCQRELWQPCSYSFFPYWPWPISPSANGA